MNSLEINKGNFLSKLLPYDTSTKINGSLRISLKEYTLLLVAAQKAIDALKAGDLEQFNAVVDDNACQIRAVKVAMPFTKYLESVESIQLQIEKVQEKIGLLSNRQYPNSKEDSIGILGNEEFEGYRKMAKKDGYALENPSVFFIQHVYPSTVCKISPCLQKTQLAAPLLQAFLPKRSIGEWPQRAVTKIMSYIED